MADAAAPPVRELPPEIWKLILSNLEDSHLITCRFVNRCWRRLADEVLREGSSLWKPSFKDVSDLASGRCGTRFSAPEHITRFMEEMEGTLNPFPNGTVIIRHLWGLTEDEDIAHLTNFCRLVDIFKDSILNLVYDANEIGQTYRKSAISELNFNNWLRAILSLKKLKSLVIDANLSWEESFRFLRSIRSQKLFKEMLEANQVTFPEELKELRVEGVGGVLPLAYMFQGSESVLKSVSSLEMSNNNGCIFPVDPDEGLDFSMAMSQFPNLKQLKVRYANAEFLQMLQQFKPGSVDEISEVELNVKEAFELLDFHADTLELLHLEVGPCHWEEEQTIDTAGKFTSVKYTKLKTLVFQYEKNSPLGSWPVGISELMAKLVNLQEFKLAGPPAKNLSPRDYYERVVAFWDLLPATVNVIHVPSYGWKVKRGESRQFDY